MDVAKIIDSLIEKATRKGAYSFLQHVSREHRDVDKSRLHTRLHHEYRMNFANLTQFVDYQCQFKDGHCKRGGCCCTGCRAEYGYLNIFDDLGVYDHSIDTKIVLFYAQHFSVNTGFWRANRGCILPRQYRSTVCLCYNHAEQLNDYDELLLETIRELKHNDFEHEFATAIYHLLTEHYKQFGNIKPIALSPFRRDEYSGYDHLELKSDYKHENTCTKDD